MPKIRPRGFTLLELLIAVLVFSLGLIGMAGLTMLSIKTNHAAYMRTQASFIAQTMADRMRANIFGVWGQSPQGPVTPYTGTYSAAGEVGAGCSPCGPSDIVAHDQVAFTDMLYQFLPNATATITCTAATTPTLTDLQMQRPYDGFCTISISWIEAPVNQGLTQSDATGAGDANWSQYTMNWAFQP